MRIPRPRLGSCSGQACGSASCPTGSVAPSPITTSKFSRRSGTNRHEPRSVRILSKGSVTVAPVASPVFATGRLRACTSAPQARPLNSTARALDHSPRDVSGCRGRMWRYGRSVRSRSRCSHARGGSRASVGRSARPRGRSYPSLARADRLLSHARSPTHQRDVLRGAESRAVIGTNT